MRLINNLYNDPALLVFHGGLGDSAVEEIVARAQRAITLDLLDKAKFKTKILVTDSLQLEEQAKNQAIIEICSGTFSFGQSLRSIINKYNIKRPCYIGGSFPLLSTKELDWISDLLFSQENCIISNNFYSSDMIAFTPGLSINKVELPDKDNPLARLLAEQAGLRFIPMSRSVSNQFDIDTPTDLMLMRLLPDCGGRLQLYLKSLNLDNSRLKKAMSYFLDNRAEVIIAGRVNSYVWSRLESRTQCRIRLWAEERGMKSEERLENQKARSLAGFLLEKIDFRSFFKALAEMADAAFIDSRVLFAHFNLSESQKDRFCSDLGMVQGIENEFVREFTRAAWAAPIPVVLGGHSLVSGGMLLLLEVLGSKL